MRVVNKVLTDAYVLEPKTFSDNRGVFFESFNHETFERLIGEKIDFIQDNQSSSTKGTLRGLHFQKGLSAQSKLVRVTQGAAFDVAVDLRPDSPTFEKWFGVELTAANKLQFFIPRGFAHGFLALENDTVFQYKVDNYYSANDDGGIVWNDHNLGVRWPEMDFTLSAKDKALPSLKDIDLKTIW